MADAGGAQDCENHDGPLKVRRELVCKAFETGQHPEEFLIMMAPCQAHFYPQILLQELLSAL